MPTPTAALFDIIERLDKGSEEAIPEMLARANAFFETDFGIISHVNGETYTIEHVASPPDTISTGQTFPLGDTFCALTLEADDVVSIAEMGASSHRDHPCYGAQGLECYIGAPLILHGKRYGTLNFSRVAPRDKVWTEQDREMIRLMAHIVRQTIEQRTTKNTLAATLEALDVVHEELDLFASRAAHDLRAPLRHINHLAAFVIEDDGEKLSEESRDHLAAISERVETLDHLISGLLKYARAGLHTKPQDTHLPSLAAECVETAQTSDRATVELDIPDATLALAQAPLRSALLNLITNAIVHNDKPQPHVRIGAAIDGDLLTWRVADNGPGIPPARHQDVFVFFNKLSPGGTGLGLSFVRKSARTHDGDLRLVDTKGPGACFELTWKIGKG